MFTPKPLFKGARIALLAAASSCDCVDAEHCREIVEKSKKVLEEKGLVPVVMPSCYLTYGYLSGTDEERAKDIMDAFTDPQIDGIISIRGGYGTQRLLDLLDYDVIRKNPKWVGGYSDITALHVMLNQNGIVSYHCPMPSTEIMHGLDEYTDKWLDRCLFGGLTGELPSMTEVKVLFEDAPQTAEGLLCGGNLSLVSSSLGTPYEIDTKGKILFLEDLHEALYRLDGMFNHLRLAGKFKDAAGILLGYWIDCPDEKGVMELETVLRDMIPADKPVLYNYSCGHSLPTMSLPLGEMARIDLKTKTLTIL